MVQHMFKTIGTKLLVWMLILSALYSASCLLDIQRSTRLLVKTSDMDCTVFAVWCQFVCLVLTALLFHWQLGKVDADKPTLLKSWVATVSFMIATVPLITKAFLYLGFSTLLGQTVQWIQPAVLKWILTYAVFTLHLMFRQMSELTGSRFRALKVLLFLTAEWSISVFLMTCFYLHLGFHKTFTQTSTLLDVTATSYGHLLLASFFLFLVVDYQRSRQGVTTHVQTVQLHPPTARVAHMVPLM